MWGVLDSGASHYISRIRDDFTSISSKESVALKAAGGKLQGGVPVAFSAVLKDNELGLTRAIFYPNLPTDRLVPTGALNDLSWRVVLNPPNMKSAAISLLNGNHEVSISNLCNNILPQIEFSFSPRHISCKPEIGSNKYQDANASAYISKLDLHRRAGHLTPTKTPCPECLQSKGVMTSHRKFRPVEFMNNIPLWQLNCDFYGPLRESIRGFEKILIFICDAVNFVFIYPLSHKSAAPACVRQLVECLRQEEAIIIGEKVVHVIRSDNEKVFRSSEWSQVFQSLGIREDHSVPYSPWMNGVVERFMRSIGTGMRVMLLGCDQRLWCYCAVYYGDLHNRVRRNYPRAPQYDGMSPMEARRKHLEDKRSTSIQEAVGLLCDGEDDLETFDAEASEAGELSSSKHLRRFGCLSYVLIQPREAVKKLEPKWRKTVFLGFAKQNRGWLFGAYLPDERCSLGLRWSEIESLQARFCENILVSNLESLKPDQPLTVSSPELEAFVKRSRKEGCGNGGKVVDSQHGQVDSACTGRDLQVGEDVVPLDAKYSSLPGLLFASFF